MSMIHRFRAWLGFATEHDSPNPAPADPAPWSRPTPRPSPHSQGGRLSHGSVHRAEAPAVVPIDDRGQPVDYLAMVYPDPPQVPPRDE